MLPFATQAQYQTPCFKPGNLVQDVPFAAHCSDSLLFTSDLTKCDSIGHNAKGYFYVHNDPEIIYRNTHVQGSDHSIGGATNFFIGAAHYTNQLIKVLQLNFSLHQDSIYHFQAYAMKTSADTLTPDPYVTLVVKNATWNDTLFQVKLGNEDLWQALKHTLKVPGTGNYEIEIFVSAQDTGWIYFGLDDISIKVQEMNLASISWVHIDTLSSGEISLEASSGFTSYLWMFRPDTLYETTSNSIAISIDSVFQKLAVFGVDANNCLSAPAVYNVAQMTNCFANINAETGDFTGWSGTHGSSNQPTFPWNFPQAGINFATVTGTVTNPFALDPNCPLPNVCPFPGYGNHSIQIGNNNTGLNGQQLEYTFTVPAASPVLLLAFARVVQGGPLVEPPIIDGDPPQFAIEIFDNAMNPIATNCILFQGMQHPPNAPWILAPNRMFTPWEQYHADLTAYIGTNITIRVASINSQGGLRVGYTYLDFACSSLPVINIPPYCAQNTNPLVMVDPGFSVYQIWNSTATTQLAGINAPNFIFPSNISTPGQTYILRAWSSGNLACSLDVSFVMPQPSLVLAGVVNTTNPQCFGINNGFASVNLTTTGTPPYTYAWSMTGANTQSVNNLAPGNYSVLVTDANGCELNLNFVILDPPEVIVNHNWQLNCATGCIELGANIDGSSGLYTFAWTWELPGPVTQNASPVTIFPEHSFQICYGTASGTYPYSLVITDGFGCTYPANGNIVFNYIAPPAPNLSGDNSIVCNVTSATLTLGDPSLSSGISGFSTLYWIYPDGTIDYDPNPIITVYTDHTLGQNSAQNSGGGMYTLVLIDDNGCKYTQEVFVNRCCSDLNEATLVVTGGGIIDASFNPPPSAYMNILLDGDFEINGNVGWTNMGRVMMTPGSSIKVEEPNTFYSSRMRYFGCDHMWDGFTVIQTVDNNNCTPIANFVDSQIEDAFTAFTVQDGGSIRLKDCLLEDNYVGIAMGPFDASYNNDVYCGSIENTTIRTIQSTPTLPWSLLPPLVGHRGNQAIVIRGDAVNFPNSKVDFAQSSYGNRISLFDRGVFTEQVNLRLNYWEIDSIYGPHTFNNPPQNNNFHVAIQADGSSTQVQEIELEHNKTMQSSMGIFVKRFAEVEINYNEIELLGQKGSRCITYMGCGLGAGDIEVDNNTLKNAYWGIRGHGSRVGANIKLRDNDIDLYAVNASAGIDINEFSATPVSLRITGNSIKAMSKGIHVVGNTSIFPANINLRIIDNEVLMNNMLMGANFSSPNYGIYTGLWNKARITQNQVTGTYANAMTYYNLNKLRGIELHFAPSAFVNCNFVSTAAMAILGTQKNPLSIVTNNHLYKSHKGIAVANDGEIGQQGTPGFPSDNHFFGPFITADLYSWESPFAGPFNQIFGRANAQFVPQLSFAVPVITGATPCINTQFLCYNSISADNTLPIVDCGWVPAGGGNSSLQASEDTIGTPNLYWMQVVAEDTLRYPASSYNTRWLDRLSVYRTLQQYPNYLDSALILEDFWVSMEAGDQAKLLEITSLMALDSIDSALHYVYAWYPSDNIAEHYQYVLKVILQQNASIPEFDKGTLANLREIAELCPAETGEAGVWPRTLLSWVDLVDELNLHACEDIPNPRLSEEDTLNGAGGHPSGILIYPNPADTEVHVVLGETSDFDTDIYIHDLLGVLRASGEIAADDWEDTIATNSLPSGVYVISIWQDGIPVKATQLLILH